MKKLIPLICFLVTMTVFVIFTFHLSMSHMSHWDEAHAWMLAKFINCANWKDILSTEGHPILWYLMLKPFSNNSYPYPMYALNYSFCLLSLITLWLLSSFKIWFKIAITFSYMFIGFFAISARNYTIGILGLFLLAGLYKKQLAKPILYSSIIAITIHTHVLLTFGALGFALIFFYKLFPTASIKYKTKIASSSIIILSLSAFIYPYLNGFNCEQSLFWAPPGFNHLFQTIFFDFKTMASSILYLSAIIIFFVTTKCIIPKLFLLFTNISMLLMFLLFYGGTAHHYLFFFIYLIITLWIYDNEKTDNNTNTQILYLITALLLLIPQHNVIKYMFPADVKPMIQFINKNIDNSKIYLAENIRYILPYLKNSDKVYDLCFNRTFNYETYIYTCPNIEFEKLKNNYYIVSRLPITHNKIKPVISYENLIFIYEIENNCNKIIDKEY